MTLEMPDDAGEQQEELGQDIELTPEMEQALGKVLLPLFAGYLQEMGLLEAGELQKTAKKERRGEMTIEETVNRLVGAQLGHEFRLSRIALAIQQLTQIVGATDGRLDALEEAQIHSDARLDALIDSQVQLTRRVDALNGRFDQMAARVGQVAENVDRLAGHVARLSEHSDALNGRFDKVAETLEALAAAQTRTDEQIRALFDRNGATKPVVVATKTVKKKSTKKTEGK